MHTCDDDSGPCDTPVWPNSLGWMDVLVYRDEVHAAGDGVPAIANGCVPWPGSSGRPEAHAADRACLPVHRLPTEALID